MESKSSKMAEKQEVRPKKSRKTTNKVRVKLPGIESYEKELEFTAEGPGRVVVRLERLMGSDRVRITDPKYLATLVERLEEEEAQGWVTRSRLRKKAEKNRSRQLAIEGLMEPASDMQDLWNHPVFRVNRVLNRLALFDQNMSHAAGTLHKVPPIHPIEIFADDDQTGRIFKSYPGHRVFARDESLLDEYETEPEPEPSAPRMSVATEGSSSSKDKADRLRNLRKSLASVRKEQETQDEEEEGDEEEEEEVEEVVEGTVEAGGKVEVEEDDEEGNAEDGEEEQDEGAAVVAVAAAPPASGVGGTSLQEMQRIYGVEPDENLVRDWEAYRSHLVDMVYAENNGVDGDDLYEMGYEVNGVYTRQQDTADDFMQARNRQITEEERVVAAEEPSNPDGDGGEVRKVSESRKASDAPEVSKTSDAHEPEARKTKRKTSDTPEPEARDTPEADEVGDGAAEDAEDGGDEGDEE
ncbi:hypothetical protein Ocin01_09262 [Orchesella cincta]|uniref:Uncharacterized protein n=1 Tax=Orchesella cincta TaxID=48709 RepID=A0A1D2MXJ6_ORCCI|nr:hypothetical protein Ocin01_09262 [Orchesella cincta]